MGGEAAKERRRLKRLEAQQGTDGKAAPSGDKPTTPGKGTKSTDKKGDKPTHTKESGGKNGAELVRMRLQRKLARKATGKFKAQLENTPPIQPEQKRKQENVIHKRKQEYGDDYRASKPNKWNSDDGNKFRGKPSANADAFQRRQSSGKGDRAPHKTNGNFRDPKDFRNNNQKDFRNQKDKNKKPFKKNNDAKHKVQKPKHLKRKMDELSQNISGGAAETSVVDLDVKMKELMEQMEKYKKLKQDKEDSAVGSKGDDKVVGKEETNDTIADDDAQEGGKDDNGSDDKEESSSDDSSASGDDDKPSKDVKGQAKKSSKGDAEVGKKKTNETIVDDAKEEVKEDESDNEESSDDDSSASGDDEPSKDGKGQTKKSSSDSSSSSSSDDDSSSDEDEIAEASNARSRGKRRRGRTDNTPAKEESTEDKPDKSEAKKSTKKSKKSNDKDSSTETETPAAPPGDPSKKTSKKDDKRRCIGRKPVTDYKIGETYSGKVKYIKPKLGAFIDIGSHSDAFCHISFTSNEFVKSVSDVLKVDDALENIRVVEIDKERKRITVSLRSEEMAENETERVKTTRQYEKGSKPRSHGFGGRSGGSAKFGSSEAGHVKFGGRTGGSGTKFGDRTGGRTGGSGTKFGAPKVESKESSPAYGVAEDQGYGAASYQAQPSGQTDGADLKRERKIARRAERRAAMEAAGTN